MGTVWKTTAEVKQRIKQVPVLQPQVPYVKCFSLSGCGNDQHCRKAQTAFLGRFSPPLKHSECSHSSWCCRASAPVMVLALWAGSQNCRATGGTLGCILHQLVIQKIISEPKLVEIMGPAAVPCFLKLCLPMTLFPSYIISIHGTPFVHWMWNKWSLLAPITAGDVQGPVTPPKQPESSPGSSNPNVYSASFNRGMRKHVLFVCCFCSFPVLGGN